MKKVLLNKRKLELGYFALVDDEDFEKVSKLNWTVLIGHTGIKYAVHKPRHTSFIYMHRFILSAPLKSIIDHKNRNGLDNRKSNLRFCNHSENGINARKIWKHNTSGYKGITWDKDRQKWAAQIQVNKKNVHLGRFKALDQAMQAREQAEKQFFGDFI